MPEPHRFIFNLAGFLFRPVGRIRYLIPEPEDTGIFIDGLLVLKPRAENSNRVPWFKNFLYTTGTWYTAKEAQVFEEGICEQLKGIPKYYPSILASFPWVLFSARDVRTGFGFISYASQSKATNAGLFLLYPGLHLERNGVDLRQVT